MSITAGIEEQGRAHDLLGELQACSELLKQRQDKKQYDLDKSNAILQAKKEWRAKLQSRRESAILNLPVSSSYIGQLIVSILEEMPGLTEKQLHEWSDELTAIPKDNFHEMVLSLCREKVLFEKKKHYYVLTVCDETLIASDPVKWAQAKCSEFGFSLTDTQKGIITAIHESNCIASNKEIQDKVGYVSLSDFKPLIDHDIIGEIAFEKYRYDTLYYLLMLSETNLEVK